MLANMVSREAQLRRARPPDRGPADSRGGQATASAHGGFCLTLILLDRINALSDAAEMLDGIDTGYEEKFDFPRWHGPPRQSWLLGAVPRSGSTFVSHLLWATGCLGAPLEYLNFEPAGPYGHAARDPAEQQRIWRDVLSRRTSPNGVFGLKTFPMLMQGLQRSNPDLLAEVMNSVVIPPNAKPRLVRLRRRDRVAQAVSYARALLSGVWRKEQEREGEEGPEFSRTAFDQAKRLIENQERAWEEVSSRLGFEPLVIWYEDCLARPEATIVAVANYLGVTLDPGARVEVPPIERQAQSGRARWIAELANEAGPDPA